MDIFIISQTVCSLKKKQRKENTSIDKNIAITVLHAAFRAKPFFFAFISTKQTG